MNIPERTSKGLNMPRVRAYDLVSNNKRKEVIQCLVQSAVTSLGSPARLFASWRATQRPGQRE
jgi:hypothetical protein